MILRQFLHTDPAIAASYIAGCFSKSACVVIDPIAEPEFYVRTAEDLGMRIRYVIDTHVHADHISTGRALAFHVAAPYVLHESAVAEFDYHAVADGSTLDAGNVHIDVLHLPGHTPEHIGLLVTDRTRSSEPWMIFTGHTLMVGDMGRTELASSAEEGAQALYESAARLRELADYITVMPGAFAGSVCGRGLSGTVTSTIGFERRFNRSFALLDRDRFVKAMLRDIPPRPANAALTRAANLGKTVDVTHCVAV